MAFQTTPRPTHHQLYEWKSWLLRLSTRIQFKFLILFIKAQLGIAPNYLCDLILRPHSAASVNPLRSSDRFDLLFSRHGSSGSKSMSFASTGPALCNELSPSLRSSILSGNIFSSLDSLRSCFFSGRCLAIGGFLNGSPVRRALYMSEYNTILPPNPRCNTTEKNLNLLLVFN